MKTKLIIAGLVLTTTIFAYKYFTTDMEYWNYRLDNIQLIRQGNDVKFCSMKANISKEVSDFRQYAIKNNKPLKGILDAGVLKTCTDMQDTFCFAINELMLTALYSEINEDTVLGQCVKEGVTAYKDKLVTQYVFRVLTVGSDIIQLVSPEIEAQISENFNKLLNDS